MPTRILASFGTRSVDLSVPPWPPAQSAERCQQVVYPLVEGNRAQIEHPHAVLEVLEAEFGPVGAERRDRAVAFLLVVVALDRVGIGHRDATPSAEGNDTLRLDQQTKLVTPILG